MRQIYWWAIVFLCFASLPLTACGQATPAAAEAPKPIKVVHLNSTTDPTRETLTAEAAKRLDIQTTPASQQSIDGKSRTVIPYAAILYDNHGNTWIYTNPQPLTFIRHQVTVDHIQGDNAVLSDGLPAGMQVVTVGAEELYGAEFEFKEE